MRFSPVCCCCNTTLPEPVCLYSGDASEDVIDEICAMDFRADKTRPLPVVRYNAKAKKPYRLACKSDNLVPCHGGVSPDTDPLSPGYYAREYGTICHDLDKADEMLSITSEDAQNMWGDERHYHHWNWRSGRLPRPGLFEASGYHRDKSAVGVVVFGVTGVGSGYSCVETFWSVDEETGTIAKWKEELTAIPYLKYAIMLVVYDYGFIEGYHYSGDYAFYRFPESPCSFDFCTCRYVTRSDDAETGECHTRRAEAIVPFPTPWSEWSDDLLKADEGGSKFVVYGSGNCLWGPDVLHNKAFGVYRCEPETYSPRHYRKIIQSTSEEPELGECEVFESVIHLVTGEYEFNIRSYNAELMGFPGDPPCETASGSASNSASVAMPAMTATAANAAGPSCKYATATARKWLGCTSCRVVECRSPNLPDADDPVAVHMRTVNGADYIEVRSAYCNATNCSNYEVNE